MGVFRPARHPLLGVRQQVSVCAVKLVEHVRHQTCRALLLTLVGTRLLPAAYKAVTIPVAGRGG